MEKLCLSALFFMFLPFMFSQENYEKDEWVDPKDDRYTFPFSMIKMDEDYPEIIEDSDSTSATHPSYLSKVYFEGIFDFNSRFATEKERFNLQGSLNTYLASSYYELFASFKSNKKNPIVVDVATFRFSPFLFMSYPHQNHLEPLLSLYVGSFTTPLSFRHLYKINFLQVSPTSKRRHYPKLNNLKLSKARGHLGVAFEVALPFFNFYFFWKNLEKNITSRNHQAIFTNTFSSKNNNEFNLYASFKNDKLMGKQAMLNVALLASFMQRKKKGFNNKNTKNYTQIYAIDFNFSHPLFFFNSLNSMSIFGKEKIDKHSFAFREEAGFSYKIFKLNAGFSYEGTRYRSSLKDKKTNFQANVNITNESLVDVFTFYVQEKMRWKIFSLAHSYLLVKQTDDANMEHSYGFFYSIGNRLALFKNELLFLRKLYTLKFSFSMHPNTYYFKTFSASSKLYFQDRNTNPLIIKKYEVNTAFFFNFMENFSCKLDASIFQENLRETYGLKVKWKREVFILQTSFFFIFMQERWKEKGILSFRYNTNQKKLDILLKVRFEY